MNGLTAAEIAARIRVGEGFVAEILLQEQERGHVVSSGGRFRLAPDFDRRLGSAFRFASESDGVRREASRARQKPDTLEWRVLDHLRSHSGGRTTAEVAHWSLGGIGADKNSVRAVLLRLVGEGVLDLVEGRNRSKIFRLRTRASNASPREAA